MPSAKNIKSLVTKVYQNSVIKSNIFKTFSSNDKSNSQIKKINNSNNTENDTKYDNKPLYLNQFEEFHL